MNTNRDGNASFTTGVGYKNYQYQEGVAIDNGGKISHAPPTLSYMSGVFAGIGATSYGLPNSGRAGTGGGRYQENFASGQQGSGSPWGAFGAPIGATSWGFAPDSLHGYGPGAGPTAIPTYWGPGGGGGAGGNVGGGGYGSGIGSNAGVSQGGLMGGFTGSPASYFGSGMSGFASGFGVYSNSPGVTIGGGPLKKY